MQNVTAKKTTGLLSISQISDYYLADSAWEVGNKAEWAKHASKVD